MDKYQERYTKHQERKKNVLVEIMKQRHSDRMFGDTPLPRKLVESLLKVTDYCPSSCNRKGVYPLAVYDRDSLALLGGLLVGGVGWIHRAPAVVLLFADPLAYKAPGEVEYMPYLDAGVMVQQLYLVATAMGLSCCYVNPNIRVANKDFFAQRFGSHIFCGAFAIGYPYE